jgi:hypothetical protein
LLTFVVQINVADVFLVIFVAVIGIVIRITIPAAAFATEDFRCIFGGESRDFDLFISQWCASRCRGRINEQLVANRTALVVLLSGGGG